MTVRNTETEPPEAVKLVRTLAELWPPYSRWVGSRMAAVQGVSYARCRLLSALNQGGSQTMKVLGERLGVSATNVTTLVDGLEADGLVARRPHPQDRRATLVEKTPKAEAECAVMLAEAEGAIAELFEGLRAADRKELLRLLTVLGGELKRRGA